MVFDIFSKREARRSNVVGDVYTYDDIPVHFRKQFIHLCNRVIGPPDRDELSSAAKFYASVCMILREEYGVFHLFELVGISDFDRSHSRPSLYELTEFLVREKMAARCLDVIELCAQQFIRIGRADELATLNQRLREAGVGFQFENSRLLRVDHQFIHAEAVKPALSFLSRKGFEGANEEFLQAHKKYRDSDYKGALVESAKAFESVLKIILLRRGQEINEKDTAARLLDKLFAINILPGYLQGQLSALRILLEGGIPKVRNKEAAHGQGEEIRDVPEYLAAYGLHQTASAILFIVKAHEAAL